MNRSLFSILAVIIGANTIAASPALGQDAISTQLLAEPSGRFEFRDAAVVDGAMNVWYCRPEQLSARTRVLFVMHGGTRETAGQVCRVVGPHVSRLDAVVVAPQFADEPYPDPAYAFAGMVDAKGVPTVKPQWGATVIERLFDRIRSGLNLEADTYDIIGFSAGGQFVHRLVLSSPDARYRRAIAGTPGRYLFPSFDVRFPYGLADGPVQASDLAQAFGRDFILVLGDADTIDRAREEEAMAQGSNRFARGLRFFATATEEAARIGAPFRWRLHILHGVDHDPIAVVRAALELLQDVAERPIPDGT